MREIGFQGRVIVNSRSEEILLFESKEDIKNKYRDILILYNMDNSKKDDIEVPEIVWSDEKDSTMVSNRIIMDILKEIFNLRDIEESIKDYIAYTLYESNIMKKNLRTYNSKFDRFISNKDRRRWIIDNCGSILKDEIHTPFEDFFVSNDWICFEPSSATKERIALRAGYKSGIKKEGRFYSGITRDYEKTKLDDLVDILHNNMREVRPQVRETINKIKSYSEDKSGDCSPIQIPLLRCLNGDNLFNYIEPKETSTPFRFHFHDNYGPDNIESAGSRDKVIAELL
jgi:hypothetical protein